ncbi:hypothetical protein PE36_00985 [Moritella sp. PE36]|uniref:hypothetical protein n=1 Tax=Moritella sp. PE36 TaxID=58051 RepID=UPI0001569011|nr:hypothetical protein [Moritella sp. PE36]EDM66219.1 hypothetical protein PE36_00985 [Moritella sp. PE36]
MIDQAWIIEIFSHLENGNPQVFFEHVSDDVVWEVTGTHPLAGRLYIKTRLHYWNHLKIK